MPQIVQFSGKVKYHLTLDPSVWIFDDRKIEINEAFNNQNKKTEGNSKGTAHNISKQWEKERTQGASFPPIDRSVKGMGREKVLQGTFVMPIKPFIENAEPEPDVKSVTIKKHDGTSEDIPFATFQSALLCFAKDGKPLKADGPVHLYFSDGSNRTAPIKNISTFVFN